MVRTIQGDIRRVIVDVKNLSEGEFQWFEKNYKVVEYILAEKLEVK